MRAKIGRGIHEQTLAAVFNVNGGPQALVAGIIRATDRTVAPDHRDAVARARAQKRDAHASIIREQRTAVKSTAQCIEKLRTYHRLGGFHPPSWIKNLPYGILRSICVAP